MKDDSKLFFFYVYVPVENVEVVKQAIFENGGGEIGNYSHCCFETLGTGQFLPKAGSNPSIGEKGMVESVEEIKLELVVKEPIVRNVIQAMKEAHPYEEVAYGVLELCQDRFL